MSDTPATLPLSYPVRLDCLPGLDRRAGTYHVRFARNAEDLDTVARLRYVVFNLELNEGPCDASRAGRDLDVYDAGCHHLMILNAASGEVIGTYRLQTRVMAEANAGFYSSSEFNLSVLPDSLLDNAVELGRACIAREHRNGRVLFLLWRGISAYLMANDMRYFFGCCSLSSQDPAEAAAMVELLRRNTYLRDDYAIRPQPGFACLDGNTGGHVDTVVQIPTLMQLYLNYGARLYGEPAIDRVFRTIDFFTVFDREHADENVKRMFFTPTAS